MQARTFLTTNLQHGVSARIMQQNIAAMRNAQAKIPNSTNDPHYHKNKLSIDEQNLLSGKRKFATQLTRMLLQTIKPQEKGPNIYLTILTAIMAEAAQCGNCGELSASVFCEFLETGIDEPIEIVYSAFIPTTTYAQDTHTFVVKNRNEQTDIFTPEVWKNTTLLDAWNRTYPLNFSRDHAPRIEDILGFARPYLCNYHFEVGLRRSHSLNEKECLDIIEFLKACLLHIDSQKNMFAAYVASEVLEYVSENDKQAYSTLEILNYYQAYFEKLKLDASVLEPIVQNYKKILGIKIEIYSAKLGQLRISALNSQAVPKQQDTAHINNDNNNEDKSPANLEKITIATESELIQALEEYLNNNNQDESMKTQFILFPSAAPKEKKAINKLIHILRTKINDELDLDDVEVLSSGPVEALLIQPRFRDLVPDDVISQLQVHLLSRMSL